MDSKTKNREETFKKTANLFESGYKVHYSLGLDKNEEIFAYETLETFFNSLSENKEWRDRKMEAVEGVISEINDQNFKKLLNKAKKKLNSKYYPNNLKKIGILDYVKNVDSDHMPFFILNALGTIILFLTIIAVIFEIQFIFQIYEWWADDVYQIFEKFLGFFGALIFIFITWALFVGTFIYAPFTFLIYVYQFIKNYIKN